MFAAELQRESHAVRDCAGDKIAGIPIRNIWLLMLYASKFCEHGNALKDLEENPDDIPDLVAEFLALAVRRRLRRQLSYGYQSRAAVLDRVRGRIDLLTTERRKLLDLGRIACRFDELTIDTPRNRFVRSALLHAAKLVTGRGNKELAHECRQLARNMRERGVSDGQVDRREDFRDSGCQAIDDRRILMAAKLIFDLALPTEDVGRRQLLEVEREEHWLRRLFERAVGGFYELVLSPGGWQVSTGKHLEWQTEDAGKTERIDEILPQMKTDIVLDRPGERRIVIDTKFTSVLKQGHHGKLSVSSPHLYQIYAYLRSQVGTEDALAASAEGVLLHPSVDGELDEAVTIQGHRIRFRTVNLAAASADIREALLEVPNGGFCQKDTLHGFDENIPVEATRGTRA